MHRGLDVNKLGQYKYNPDFRYILGFRWKYILGFVLGFRWKYILSFILGSRYKYILGFILGLDESTY